MGYASGIERNPTSRDSDGDLDVRQDREGERTRRL
jgi:hypothetical protein